MTLTQNICRLIATVYDATWYELSRKPNFQIEWVERYTDKPCDWFNISMSPNFQIEWVDKYPDKPWDFPSQC